MVNSDIILSQTHGGLDIILDLYPEAAVCLTNPKAKFRKRQSDRTPSAHIFKKKSDTGDDIWYLKDFGEPGKGMNGINLWMDAHFMTPDRFGEACMRIARQYNIKDELDRDLNRPRFTEREARADEQEGQVVYEIRDFTDEELRLLGPRVTRDTTASLHWHALEWIGEVKNRHVRQVHSTPTYPIFIRECVVAEAKGDQPAQRFFKRYEPKNTEKRFRFRYFPVGQRAQGYVNGLMEAKAAHRQYVEKCRREWESANSEEKCFDESKCKLPELVICSGERDALCVRSHGHWPIWFNSETSTDLTPRLMGELQAMAEVVYNIPDIDATGVHCGCELAKRHIELRTVWLPQESMSQFTDYRGKRLKDLRDWMDLFPTRQDFRQLLLTGKPLRFWDRRTNKDGGTRTEINTENLLYFLSVYGFHVLNDEGKEDTVFINVDHNVVRRVTSREVKQFAYRWASGGQTAQSSEIRNLILNSPRLSQQQLEMLPEAHPDFTASTPLSQTFFFRNGNATVTPDGVIFTKRVPNQVSDVYVWADHMVPHDYIEPRQPFFNYEIGTNDDGESWIQLDITDPESSHFFGYLINSSRIYWREEMEYSFTTTEEREKYRKEHPFDINGPELSEERRAEQVQNLLSKMFALGYLLHEHKTPDRAWAILSMDGKVGETGECNGGSGKSFFYKFVSVFRRLVNVSGRSGDPTKNQFWLSRVDRYTRIMLLDDLDERTPLSNFYNLITDPIVVNPKGMTEFSIPFEDSPKVAFTTNYVPSDFSPSTDRRMLYMVYSDYYHKKTADNDYLSDRQISDDFGKSLHTYGYTEAEWSADIAFALACVRLYLDLKKRAPQLKIQPPMGRIRLRRLIADMGDNFIEWAYQYFSEEGSHLDCQLVRTEVFDDFKRYSNVTNMKMKSFSTKLKKFAETCPYIHEIDPAEYRNLQGRNLSTVSACDPFDSTRKKTVEMVYMRSMKAFREMRK